MHRVRGTDGAYAFFCFVFFHLPGLLHHYSPLPLHFTYSLLFSTSTGSSVFSFPSTCTNRDSTSSLITCISGAFSPPAGLIQSIYGAPNTCPITSQSLVGIGVNRLNICQGQGNSQSTETVCNNGVASINIYPSSNCTGPPTSSPLSNGCQVAGPGGNDGPTVISCINSINPPGGYIRTNIFGTADCSGMPAAQQFEFTQPCVPLGNSWGVLTCTGVASGLFTLYNNARGA